MAIVARPPAFDGACTISLGTGTTPSGATVDVTHVAVKCVRRDAGRRANGLATDDQYLNWVQGGDVIADSGSAYSNGAAVRMPLSGGGGGNADTAAEQHWAGQQHCPGFEIPLLQRAQFRHDLPRTAHRRRRRTHRRRRDLPTALAVEGSTLYWASATAIKTLDLANDAGSPVAIAQTPLATVSDTAPRRLAISNGQAYRVTRTGKGDETVERAGLRGEIRITLALQRTWLSGGVALAGDKVFFTGNRPALMSVSPP